MIDYYEPKLDITFLGCGFLGTYHLGAIYLLKQIWPHKPFERICGASCGGLLGALLVAGIQLEIVLNNAMSIMRQLRQFFKNPLQFKYSTITSLVEQNLEKLVPSDAHSRCSNKLGVSVTRVDWLVLNVMPVQFRNQMVSEFHSRRDLIDSICAGCFIPIWSGFALGFPFRQGLYVDGAYTDNKPKFPLEHPDGHQVELSPFSGDTEVSPRDESYLFKLSVMGTYYLINWKNVVRTTHAMIPFSLDKYRAYLIGGHQDMKEYLFRRNLIRCFDCHSNSKQRHQDIRENRTTTVEGDLYHNHHQRQHNQPSACLSCLKLLERVDSLKMSSKFIELVSE